MRFVKQWEMREWAYDINSYFRWKKLFDTYQSLIAKKQMERIKAKWPNHQQAFE